jgi:hypothetical protein
MIAMESSVILRNPQVADTPQALHARLQALLWPQPRPESKPQPEVTLFDVRRWQRNSRGLRAQRILQHIDGPADVVGAVLGCTGRAVSYWKRGEHSPTPKHYKQLCALRLLCLYSR